MPTASENIITVNAGSSSIKIAVFAHNSMMRFYTLSITDIGQPVSALQIAHANEPVQTKQIAATDHKTAATVLIEQLAQIISPESILAIGHRLVHGGARYTEPTSVTAITAGDWELFSQLDSEHTPVAHQIIDQFQQQYPHTTRIACFDTAFFHDLPRVAQIVPIPQKYFADGVRRYGFHGLSYTSLLAVFSERAGEAAVNGRVILAHLGSGTSITATQQGKPIDTTMGFTPTSGVAMSTRPGDLDPNIFSFLQHQHGMTIEEFSRMVRFESGLAGISDSTGDMHALVTAEHEDANAALAVEYFIRSVEKAIGALATTLGGVDSLIFSGGIGEQSDIIRARICQDLAYMGIELNHEANAAHAFLISASHSRVGVHVIPSDEASVIAEQAKEYLHKTDNK